MKKSLFTIIAALLLSVAAIAQVQGVGTVPGQTFAQQLNPAAATTAQAGNVTNPASNFIINISPGPIVCSASGVTDWVNQSQMTLQASTTYLLVYNCFNGSVYTKTAVTGPGSSGTSVGVPTSLLFADPQKGEISIATIVCGTTNCGNSANGSITDNRVAGSFPVVADYVYDALPNCFEAASANAGSGDGTFVLNGSSPGMVALKGILSASGAATNLFTCNINIPTHVTSGHGVVQVLDITWLVSTVTTQPTSITTVTFKSNTAPAAAGTETASSATMVDLTGGGTTLLPTSTQFAALSPSTAGQLFSIKETFTANPSLNTDITQNSASIGFAQSAASAQTVLLSGVKVHYAFIPN